MVCVAGRSYVDALFKVLNDTPDEESKDEKEEKEHTFVSRAGGSSPTQSRVRK